MDTDINAPIELTDNLDIKEKIRVAKKRLLEMHFSKKMGHIGGNLSALDAMMVLHHEIMEPEDKFILSKGHSAGALYVVLWSINRLSDADLLTFHSDNTKLAGHPVSGWLPEIPTITGSLGHGFPVGLGMALGSQLIKKSGHIYCLMSDGEWQEGSNWEALIFFSHRKLPNLTLLIDVNGLQGFGSTREIASMDTLHERLSAFNIDVIQINGHDPSQIKAALQNGKGKIIILNTVKGAGVSFMENRMEWHYLPLSESQFHQAIREIDNA